MRSACNEPRVTVGQFVAIVLCGLLSGLVVGLLSAILEASMLAASGNLLPLGHRPVVRPGDQPLMMNDWTVDWIANLFYHYTVGGLLWGLVGGVITAGLCLYWPQAAQPREASCFWAILLASSGLAVWVLRGYDKGFPEGVRILTVGSIVGGAYGLMLSTLIRLAHFLRPRS